MKFRKGVNPMDKIFGLALGIFVLIVVVIIAIQISEPMRGGDNCLTIASVISDFAGGVNIC